MSGQLLTSGDDGAERCSFCSADAAGPCATCRRPVCGDCSTLTEGGVQVWAICLDCDRKRGRSLSTAWLRFGGFLLGILALLAGIVALMSQCDR